MKANEAPEKIYIQKRKGCNYILDSNILEYDSEWTPIPLIREDNVEYIRTDAFIEKACEWIKTNMDDYIHVVYDTVTGMPTDEAYIADKIVVEDFTNYIKSKFETKSYERTKI